MQCRGQPPVPGDGEGEVPNPAEPGNLSAQSGAIRIAVSAQHDAGEPRRQVPDDRERRG
jgi:hypothetical protein